MAAITFYKGGIRTSNSTVAMPPGYHSWQAAVLLSFLVYSYHTDAVDTEKRHNAGESREQKQTDCWRQFVCQVILLQGK